MLTAAGVDSSGFTTIRCTDGYDNKPTWDITESTAEDQEVGITECDGHCTVNQTECCFFPSAGQCPWAELLNFATTKLPKPLANVRVFVTLLAMFEEIGHNSILYIDQYRDLHFWL